MEIPPPAGRADGIFQAVLDLDSSAREMFVTKACGGDPALLAEVRALLAAHEEMPTEFLAEPAREEIAPDDLDATVPALPVATPPMRAAERVGEMIGPYKLREQVGEGGFGTVWVADQEKPVRRRVALKIIKMGMDTKEVIARFEQERQALAMMDHPNIARVLDAGVTQTGRPYFVMELVRGVKITEYCDSKGLSTGERIDLFIHVCQAVQHAHQKGIIHRDIKPSNILVTLHDGVPVPKVIDFGIAKATEGRLTDATVYTQLHQMIGTPAYMSPEQAEMSGLDIDTRSDIYSLGVLLYELLAGSTPFDAKELMARGIDAMRKIIRESEPQRPSTRLAALGGEEATTTAKRRSADTAKLMHQLKGDLDWIVMKCLEKDRTRRYDTANGLAADLKRHLDNEPVVARPPSAVYKFQKLARRNKLAFAAVGAVTMALVLGIIASTWQAVRATRATREAVAAGHKAEAAQREAQKNFDAARAAEKDALQQAANAQEVSDRSSASFMFSQGRLRDALTHIRAALKHADSFENRFVATEIVEQARNPFVLKARVTLAEPPRLAAALAEKSVVIASASALHLISLPEAKPAATLALPGTPRYLLPLDPGHFLVVLPDRLLTCTAAPLAIAGSTPLDADLLDLAATPDGKTLALLFTSKVEARAAGDLTRVIATAPAKLRVPRAGTIRPFSVSISPSGRTILALGSDPWAPSTILDVAAGTHREIMPKLVNCRLLDDTTLIARGTTLGDNVVDFWTADFSGEKVVNKTTGTIAGVLTSGSTDLYLAAAKPGAPAGAPRQIFVADQASVDLATFPTFAPGPARRYDSLWPQGEGRVTRIGLSPDTGGLFLASGNDALVFFIQPTQRKTFNTAFWSTSVTPDACYTVTKRVDPVKGAEESTDPDATNSVDQAKVMLMERRFDRHRPRTFPLAWPDVPSQPWGLAVASDGRTAAVLCQESNNTTVSGNYYEKYLLIYELPPEPPADKPIPIARRIHLSELSGADGRANGQPAFSPDGKTLLYYTASGICGAYTVETGAPIWSTRGLVSIAVSPTGDLVAGGDYRTGAPLVVRDAATGRVVYTTPKSYKTRKLALTSDRKLLAAVDEDTFLTIDLATGEESSRSSTLCPSAVSPDGTRMIAFLPEEPGLLTGSTVLADYRSHRIIAVLNPGSHLLNFATFTPQGDRAVLCRHRSSVSVIGADPWERLAAALEVPNFPMAALPRTGTATAAQFAALHPPPLAPLPVAAAGGGAAPARPLLRADDGPGLAARIDAEVEAEGTISSARWSTSGAVMIVEFAGGNNRGLIAAIFSGSRKNFDTAFPPDVAAFLPGKSVRIRGKLEKYSGKSERYTHYPQIVLNSPDQLTVVNAAPAPAAGESPAADGLRMDATDHAGLAGHLDSNVTVSGTIRTAAWTANASIFNIEFDDDHEHGLLVVIFPKTRAAFEKALGGDLEKALAGKTVEVKGKLAAYGGRTEEWKKRPQIVLNLPGQLRVVPVADADRPAER